jgi:hypothetical protein
MLPRFLLLMAGVFACSTAVIMIKLCDLAVENPVLLASLRCLVAAAALGPLFGCVRQAGQAWPGHAELRVIFVEMV